MPTLNLRLEVVSGIFKAIYMELWRGHRAEGKVLGHPSSCRFPTGLSCVGLGRGGVSTPIIEDRLRHHLLFLSHTPTPLASPTQD
jgi:hypothetical protein